MWTAKVIKVFLMQAWALSFKSQNLHKGLKGEPTSQADL